MARRLAPAVIAGYRMSWGAVSLWACINQVITCSIVLASMYSMLGPNVLEAEAEGLSEATAVLCMPLYNPVQGSCS